MHSLVIVKEPESVPSKGIAGMKWAFFISRGDTMQFFPIITSRFYKAWETWKMPGKDLEFCLSKGEGPWLKHTRVATSA